MNKKFMIFVLIVVVMLVTLSIKLFSIYHDDNSYLFATYHGFETDGDTIVKYNSGGGNIVIPKMVNGVTITKIADHVFEGKGISGVVIPNTITTIGDYAFSNNKITSLKIPDSVAEIGDNAFSHNSISSLSLSSKTIVGKACFNDNILNDEDAFFYQVLENGQIDYSKIVSYGGKMRSSVLIPSSKNGVELLTIGENSFSSNKIVAVSIPDTVETIESEAFSDNYLVELHLSSNVKNIEKDSFSSNSYLSEISIDNYVGSILNYPWGSDDSDLYWLKK